MRPRRARTNDKTIPAARTKLDFCPFLGSCVNVFMKQNGAALSVSRGVESQPLVLGPGGPDEQYTSSGGAAQPRSRRRMHATDLPAFCDSVAGRDSHPRTTNDPQSAANRSFAGSRSSLELPPRLVPAAWVAWAMGPCAGGGHPASRDSRRRGESVRGRHGRRGSGKEGLRQGLSPRRGPLDPFVHGLPLGTPVGGVGHFGEVSVRQATVGLARSRGAVSFQGMGPRARTTPPDPLGTQASAS